MCACDASEKPEFTSHHSVVMAWLCANGIVCINEATKQRTGLALRWVTTQINSASTMFSPILGNCDAKKNLVKFFMQITSTRRLAQISSISFPEHVSPALGKKRQVLANCWPCYQDNPVHLEVLCANTAGYQIHLLKASFN